MDDQNNNNWKVEVILNLIDVISFGGGYKTSCFTELYAFKAKKVVRCRIDLSLKKLDK